MKWSAGLLGALALLGLLWFLLTEREEAPPSVAALPTAAAPAPSLSVTAPAAADPPPIQLRALAHLAGDPGRSQAWLSVERGQAQLFRNGETVTQQWTLQSIQSDHVIVARDGAATRLDLVPGATAAAATAASKPSAATDQPLPGFSPGPTAAVRTPAALEANRRFMQDRRERAEKR